MSVQDIYKEAWANKQWKHKIVNPNLFLQRATMGGSLNTEGVNFINLSYLSSHVLGKELAHTTYVPQGFIVGNLGKFTSMANLMLWLSNPLNDEFRTKRTKDIGSIIKAKGLKYFQSKYEAQVLAYGYWCRISQSVLADNNFGLPAFMGKFHCYHPSQKTEGRYETKNMDYIRQFAIEDIRKALIDHSEPEFEWLWDNDGYQCTLEELCKLVLAERQERKAEYSQISQAMLKNKLDESIEAFKKSHEEKKERRNKPMLFSTEEVSELKNDATEE